MTDDPRGSSREGDDPTVATPDADPTVTTRETLVDAGLAAVVLLVVLAAAVVAGSDTRPVAALAGGLGTLGAEALAGRHEARVRRWWRRPAVKTLSILLAVGAIAVGIRLAPDPALSAAAGALGVYLLLLAAVRVGLVGPPRSWTG